MDVSGVTGTDGDVRERNFGKALNGPRTLLRA